MAFAYVQQLKLAADASPATSASFSKASVVGNLIVVVVVGTSSQSTVSSVTDNKGNTYTLVPGSLYTTTWSNISVYYAQVTAGGSGLTVTVAWDDAKEAVRFVGNEFTGFSGRPTVDQVKVAVGSSTTPASGTTDTTARPYELVIGVLARDGTSAATVGFGTGFSNVNTTTSTTAASMESRAVTTASGYNATFTLTQQRAWIAEAITFYDVTTTGFLAMF
jgi:hypothetical protein